jgi:hypothetical protein
MREKSGSRSPRRDVRDGSLTRPDVRDRRVSFEDERGRPLAHQIPAASTGRFKALRNSVPRRDGESRSHWKSRMMTQLAQEGPAKER